MLIPKRLGQTDLSVSPLGLGTVKLGRNQKVNYPSAFDLPEDDQVKRLLDLAWELGINLLDTAPAYGTSEERLGKLMADSRHDWVISTKVGEEFADGESYFDFTPAQVRLSIERSLRRLRRDYIDMVLVHSDGNDSAIIERYEIFDVLTELKRAGWLRAFGMSTKTLEGGLLTAQHADLVMVTYNLNHRTEEAVIDECLRLNKGVMVKKALASGHLCNDDATDDPVQTSMNFVFHHPGVSSAIVGTINPQHLRDNVSKALLALHQD
ncbi:MAG TPA: aldo/keto reductase [Cellvibrio sp.]|nr:aldo/keto reductase [Cellvibrio sp.]